MMVVLKNLFLAKPAGLLDNQSSLKKLYLRDSYCSKVSKTGYIYHPVDLMVQWGMFKKNGYDKASGKSFYRAGWTKEGSCPGHLPCSTPGEDHRL